MAKRLVLRRAAGVLPVSGDIARSLDLRGAPVLRMGVDTAAIRAAVGDRAPEDGLLLYIGRLVDKKGVDVLVEALARLDGARLEVVGDGPDRAALHELAARVRGTSRPGALPGEAAPTPRSSPRWHGRRSPSSPRAWGRAATRRGHAGGAVRGNGRRGSGRRRTWAGWASASTTASTGCSCCPATSTR